MTTPRTPLVVALAAGLSACVSSHTQATGWNVEGDFTISSIGIARFENLTNESRAGNVMTAALTNELKRRAEFEIKEIGGGEGTFDRWTAARLAKEAKTSAALVGVVTAYEYRPGAQGTGAVLVPTLAVDVRLVAVPGGEVLWSAGVELHENSLVSYDGVPLEELTQDAAAQIADALERVRVEQ